MFDIGISFGAIFTGYLLTSFTYEFVIFLSGVIVLISAFLTIPLLIKKY